MKEKLELVAKKEFQTYEEMYKVVDFLNKNLKEMNIIVGMSTKEDKHVISIYKYV